MEPSLYAQCAHVLTVEDPLPSDRERDTIEAKDNNHEVEFDEENKQNSDLIQQRYA
jgi:hypothetical protein